MSNELYKDYVNELSISGLADKYKISKMRVYKEIAEQSVTYGKAIAIINEKGLPLGERDMILHSKDYEEYNIKFSWANFKNISIQKTKEEFKMLKEVLKWNH